MEPPELSAKRRGGHLERSTGHVWNIRTAVLGSKDKRRPGHNNLEDSTLGNCSSSGYTLHIRRMVAEDNKALGQLEEQVEHLLVVEDFY